MRKPCDRTGCEEVRPRLGLFWRGELESAESERVREHLKVCAACEDRLSAHVAAALVRGEITASSAVMDLRPPREAVRDFIAPYRERFGVRATGMKGVGLARARAALAAACSLWAWITPRALSAGAVAGDVEVAAELIRANRAYVPVMGAQAPTGVTVLNDIWQPVGECNAFRITQPPALTQEGRFVLVAETEDSRYEGWRLLCTVRAVEGRRVTFEGTVTRVQRPVDDATAPHGATEGGPAGAQGAPARWEVRIDEPFLDSAETDVVIPPDAFKLYLAPAAGGSGAAR